MEKSYNNYQGKLLLAEVRDNQDFAHPGEEEAIELLLKQLSFRSYSTILEAGAGLGATLDIMAKSLRCHEVVGTDIDSTSVSHARSKYPNYKWICCDTQSLSHHVTTGYDLIYLFNAFYCIPDQKKALLEINKLLKFSGVLAISDYYDRRTSISQHFLNPFATAMFKPLGVKIISDIKQQFNVLKELDISDYYAQWYSQFLKKMLDKRPIIIKKFGTKLFDEFFNKYDLMLEDILSKKLGGIIIIAEK
ncbi:class I SAM-dependent methyltransferase [Aquella oligotrophica]|uniref:Methyltransferase type 12 domain-containing protein n=1 Tax=Aquella oligotrophica TaxID=2067065 RepID=A0A2I7N8L9_9NEIS|nr:class I SAM-dependent methyltransferase [Aquella oligotrophica]AUR52798.1 hypothetical protein CUN60_11005 [Aquella oligotrophica]